MSAIRSSADTTVAVDPESGLSSVSQALASLPADAGSVTILVSAASSSKDDALLILPSDKGITSLIIKTAAADENVSLPEVIECYANGIPLTIEEGVSLPNGSVFGGGYAPPNASAVVASADITVNGNAAYVYGGGKALEGSRSIVTGNAHVWIGPAARIYWEVFGGGLASGSGSFASVESTSVEIFGTVDYALGGSSAQDGGAAKVVKESALTVQPSGRVAIAAFGGGSARGSGSLLESADTLVVVHGQAGWVFGGDFAYQGGETALNGTASVEITREGSVREVYGGSFATDAESKAIVRETKIRVDGTSLSSTPLGIGSNGGLTRVEMQP